MIKTTVEEKIRFKLNGFGQKNKVCRFLAKRLDALNRGFFGVCRFIPANLKRLSMVILSGFLFTVYSSFTFPIFAQSQAYGSGIEIDEDSARVVFAEEKNFSLEELEQLGALEEDDETQDEDGLYGLDEILINSGISLNGEKSGEHAERESFSADDWRLILVNKTHYIPDDYEFPLGTIKGSFQCDKRILEDLLTMIQAAKEDGVNLLVASPYRNHDRQTSNFYNKIVKYMKRGMTYMEAYKQTSCAITIPDTSEHQIGLALDIWTDSYKSLSEGFGETDAGIWLAENSYRYGFVLRYPKGKEEITGIEYEPWHFRYVGYEAAKVMFEERLTLEEFWDQYLDLN